MLLLPAQDPVVAAAARNRIVFAAIPGSASSDAPSCQNRGDTELFTILPDNSGFRRLTNTRMREATPSWSPDQDRIAYSATPRDDFNLDIYSIRSDGSRRKQLTDTAPQRESMPEWSPDGERILFIRIHPKDPEINSSNDARSLWVIDRNGRNEQVVIERRRDPYLNAGWSPDSRRIVYTSQLPGDSGNNGLFVKNLSTDRKRMILRTSDVIGFPDWSPDGRWILYSRASYGEGPAWRIRPDGSRNQKVLEGGDEKAVWSPSSDRIAYLTASKEMCQDHVWIANERGERKRELYPERDLETYWVDW